jgi:hypothetical protein
MYQLDNTHFCIYFIVIIESFPDMIKYLEVADTFLTDKIDRIDLKIENVYEEFVRTSSVYELNNKKRQK